MQAKDLEQEQKMVLKPTHRNQVGGTHYKEHKVQPWDIIDEYGFNFYEGSALKYLMRIKDDRVTDLKKAIHYLEKEIELLEMDKLYDL